MKIIHLTCIIEDDPLHLFITKKYIELSGFNGEILAFKNGKEAFHGLNDRLLNNMKLPQVIFLDLNMPVWDGWKFLDEFIKLDIKQDITMCILTSSNSEEDIKRADSYNLKSNYLIKPIELEDLEHIFNNVVE